LVFGDLSPQSLATLHCAFPNPDSTTDGCDRSQTTKALTGQRTPKSG